MAAARLLLLPAAPISPVQGGLLFHGGEEGDAEMAVKGQIDDDIPGRVDVTDLSADVLDHRSGCPSTGWTDAQCFSRWFLLKTYYTLKFTNTSAKTITKAKIQITTGSGIYDQMYWTKTLTLNLKPGKTMTKTYFIQNMVQAPEKSDISIKCLKLNWK